MYGKVMRNAFLCYLLEIWNAIGFLHLVWRKLSIDLIISMEILWGAFIFGFNKCNVKVLLGFQWTMMSPMFSVYPWTKMINIFETVILTQEPKFPSFHVSLCQNCLIWKCLLTEVKIFSNISQSLTIADNEVAICLRHFENLSPHISKCG